ncbi:MAG: hypothetical protein ACLP50_16290 [Solirubrobacteraceae bacterium]
MSLTTAMIINVAFMAAVVAMLGYVMATAYRSMSAEAHAAARSISAYPSKKPTVQHATLARAAS